MNGTVKVIIFDLGNCLWFQPNPPPDDAIFAIEAAGIAPLFEAWEITPPKPLQQLIADVWVAMEEAYEAGIDRQTYREPSLPFLWQGALAQFDIDITEEQAEQVWHAGWISVRHFGYQLYPDSLDVLRELKSRGYGIGLCTNRPCTEDMLWPDLEDFGLARYLDAATCSGDTGYFKPHAAPFERALTSLGIEAHRALMVGDSEDADMRGAKALGMHTAWKLNGRYGLAPSPHADVVVHDLNELLDLPLLGGAGTPPPPSPTPHEDDNEDRW